jgi:small subunit ribosomal protein S15
MPLAKEEKDKIIKKYKTHATDTGSPEVQIALLTAEIEQLTGHLKTHKKDFSSRRGLLKKVGARQRLLRFFQRENPTGFDELVKKLKLKVSS